jgi:hypothetical protein
MLDYREMVAIESVMQQTFALPEPRAVAIRRPTPPPRTRESWRRFRFHRGDVHGGQGW